MAEGKTAVAPDLEEQLQPHQFVSQIGHLQRQRRLRELARCSGSRARVQPRNFFQPTPQSTTPSTSNAISSPPKRTARFAVISPSLRRGRPESTYCGRSRPRSWTPQLGGDRPYGRRLWNARNRRRAGIEIARVDAAVGAIPVLRDRNAAVRRRMARGTGSPDEKLSSATHCHPRAPLERTSPSQRPWPYSGGGLCPRALAPPRLPSEVGLEARANAAPPIAKIGRSRLKPIAWTI